MKAKTFTWLALAFVGAVGAFSQACGPDKPPLTPDTLDIDAGAVPDMPSATATPSSMPKPSPG